MKNDFCKICGNRITAERRLRHALYCSTGCYRKAMAKRRAEVARELRSDEAALADGTWRDRYQSETGLIPYYAEDD